MSMHAWHKTLKECMLEYRTSVHGSTGYRPVDLFFSFNVHGYLSFINSKPKSDAMENNLKSQIKNKRYVDRNSTNRIFLPGDTVLVHNVNASKFNIKGDLAKVLRQFDTHSVEVQFVDGGG